MKLVIYAAAVLFSAASAPAAPVTYDFEASFSFRSSDVPTNSVADAAEDLGNLSGSFTFDDELLRTETGDTGPSPNFTRSLYSVIDLRVDGLDLSGVALPDLFRIEENDVNDTVGLVYEVDPPAVSWERVSLFLIDNTRTVFDSIDLPDTIDLADFDLVQLYFFGENADGGFERTNFTITSLSKVAPIPLPAGGALLLSGLLGMVLMRRRRT
ncbi:VPLPA-CTERM sorting domain-containing protein [Dinoroseobacter sp. PD6]|uniref:VPLPA-CTERM sorting domain-containing protein n=1 Tax=Dinoroseobacter sp. PD6 TaxID=3028384 RepID=UPI00237B6245|nr:VPLPA-CTERM sorting domain-containing protein [Dinoroseobacter sp. PD6]MDD9715701.1 VPLPA-CTERM sorting domain-containing protein [Dinoroseobacter sp. PD6]